MFQVDILVNNAGRSQRAEFQAVDIRVDRELFDINTFAPVNISRILVRRWLERNEQGHIVLVSSIAGVIPAPFSCTYNSSKFALQSYFDTLRNETFDKNISVTLTYPGPVVSNILRNAYTEKFGVVVNQSHDSRSKRMKTQRCAKLIVLATANKVYETYITIQPLLTLAYIYTYLPFLAKYIFPYFARRMAGKFRDGRTVQTAD